MLDPVGPMKQHNWQQKYEFYTSSLASKSSNIITQPWVAHNTIVSQGHPDYLSTRGPKKQRSTESTDTVAQQFWSIRNRRVLKSLTILRKSDPLTQNKVYVEFSRASVGYTQYEIKVGYHSWMTIATNQLTLWECVIHRSHYMNVHDCPLTLQNKPVHTTRLCVTAISHQGQAVTFKCGPVRAMLTDLTLARVQSVPLLTSFATWSVHSVAIPRLNTFTAWLATVDAITSLVTVCNKVHNEDTQVSSRFTPNSPFLG